MFVKNRCSRACTNLPQIVLHVSYDLAQEKVVATTLGVLIGCNLPIAIQSDRDDLALTQLWHAKPWVVGNLMTWNYKHLLYEPSAVGILLRTAANGEILGAGAGDLSIVPSSVEGAVFVMMALFNDLIAIDRAGPAYRGLKLICETHDGNYSARR